MALVQRMQSYPTKFRDEPIKKRFRPKTEPQKGRIGCASSPCSSALGIAIIARPKANERKAIINAQITHHEPMSFPHF